MRCFIACFVGDGALELSRRCPEIDGVRWLPLENLHVTLRFLGEIDAMEVARTVDLVAALAGVSTAAAVAGLDGFPRRRRARVVVARLAGVAALERWSMELAEVLGEPDKPFAAHVTLGRSRRGAKIPEAPEYGGFEIALSAPALYESLLDSTGARYRRITAGGDSTS